MRTAQGLWQHILLRAAGANLEILTLGLGGIEHGSITFLQRRKTPKRLCKNGKQTLMLCDFHHWQNYSEQPWNAFAHSMKLINHDLKDKWMLDSVYWVISSDEPVFIRMNCTTLLATTQSHHLPYLDISQTQQPYFELSKDLNTIHAYGTLPPSIYIAQLVEQLLEHGGSRFESCFPCLFGPSRAQPIETSHISRPRVSFGKKLKSFCTKAFEAQSLHGASRWF